MHHVGGPIWIDPIHDADFVDALLKRLHAPEGPVFGAHKRRVSVWAAAHQTGGRPCVYLCVSAWMFISSVCLCGVFLPPPFLLGSPLPPVTP